MPHRVIQWSTGHVGVASLACIITHPELELAGLVVHSEDKAGRDAGELCGLPATGVLATTDVDAAVALDADVVCYTATADLRPDEAAEDLARILRSGKDVVSTSIVTLVHPTAAPDQALVARLEEACREGGTSCFTTGIDPGFANDLLPLTLLGVCERVDSVRVMEILNYATYDQTQTLFDVMGFGGPLDAEPLLLLPGVLGSTWGPTLHMLAESLGVELDEVRETHEKVAHDTPFEVAGRTIEPGTQAGLRFEVQGIVGGEPRIVLEHVTRLHDDVAPDWPRAGSAGGGYRVDIAGKPAMACELEITSADGDHNAGGMVVCAMRMLNAITAVRAAPPGLVSTLDLPLVTGRGALR